MVKVTVKNGITFIDTKGINRIVDGKYRVVGITEEYGKYRANISVGTKAYLIGRFKTMDEAVAARQQAEEHKKAGDLLEWLENRKKKG